MEYSFEGNCVKNTYCKVVQQLSTGLTLTEKYTDLKAEMSRIGEKL